MAATSISTTAAIAKVFQYKLGEPWNVESATYFAELDISKQQRAVRGTQFDPSGKRLFILDTIKRTIFEFDLATAWDLRSATPGATFALNDRFNNPRGLTWRPDGKAFFVTETKSETIHAYHLPDDGSLARHNHRKRVSADDAARQDDLTVSRIAFGVGNSRAAWGEYRWPLGEAVWRTIAVSTLSIRRCLRQRYAEVARNSSSAKRHARQVC